MTLGVSSSFSECLRGEIVEVGGQTVDADDVIELGYRLLVAVEAVADQLAGGNEANPDTLLDDLHQAAGRLAPLVAHVDTLPRSLPTGRAR